MSKYRIKLNGKTYEMEVVRADGSESEQPKVSMVAKAADPVADSAPKAAEQIRPGLGSGAVQSPMPGTIIQVCAVEGEMVKQHQVILVLEAMKMENEITAPRDGKIVRLYVAKGAAVQGGAPLFEIGE